MITFVRCCFCIPPIKLWTTDFRSNKTADVIRRVGLERLVLESDHEDAALVADSIEASISFIAEALQVERDVVIRKTSENAFHLYGLCTQDEQD
jgi:Tat protein secretion system quality control protein TatD with DNase activity